MSANSSVVLVVEDEDSLRSLLVRELKINNHTVIESKNGQDGLSLALKQKPDLIILDVVMPVMDGLEMARMLRKDEWGNTVPIIMLTNLSNIEHINSALEENVHDYIVKSDTSLSAIAVRAGELIQN
jgi:two-component system alkaline phosphatase synthesis response regulator PhoP